MTFAAEVLTLLAAAVTLGRELMAFRRRPSAGASEETSAEDTGAAEHPPADV